MERRTFIGASVAMLCSADTGSAADPKPGTPELYELRTYALIQNPVEGVRHLILRSSPPLNRDYSVIRIQLPADELRLLRQTFRDTADRRLRDRAQIVLLAQRGRPHQDIAEDLGIAPRTVQRWLNAYLERGWDGLQPRHAPGAKPKLTEDLAPVLQQWVLGGPVRQGLDRANWTYAELADHLYKSRGIRVQKSAMQVFCSRHDIRPYRPTYRFLRGDAAKQAAARADLAELKKKRRRATSFC
jgi:transposase